MKCSRENLLTWQKQGSRLGLIDIREFYETPEIDSQEVEHVPFGELLQYKFIEQVTYILICTSGGRATAAVMEITRKYPHLNIYALEGGAMAYLG